MECFNYETPNWTLLEEAIRAAGLPVAVTGEFMWMGEWKEGEHSYKHRDSREYVRLTDSTPQSVATEAIRMART